jgi:hypothetical protein
MPSVTAVIAHLFKVTSRVILEKMAFLGHREVV